MYFYRFRHPGDNNDKYLDLTHSKPSYTVENRCWWVVRSGEKKKSPCIFIMFIPRRQVRSVHSTIIINE